MRKSSVHGTTCINPSVYENNAFIDQKIVQLQKSLEYDIITYEQMLTEIKKLEDKRKNLIHEIHPYKISKVADTYGKEKKSYFRWVTRVPDESKPCGTRKIQANSEEAVYEKLYEFYKLKEPNPDNETVVHPLSLAGLYESWVQYRLTKVKASTVDRDMANWKKYYEGEEITLKPIPSLRPSEVFQWMSNKVTALHLTRRQYTDMRGIWKMIEGFAYNDDMIERRIVKDMEQPEKNRFADEAPRHKSVETFSPNELAQLVDMAMTLYEKSHFNTSYLGLILECNFGFRVGELCCLRWDGIDYIHKTITIRESEAVRYRVEGTKLYNDGYETMEHLKKGAKERIIPLTPEAEQMFSYLRSEYEKHGIHSEYVFVQRNGERIHTRSFHKALQKVYAHLNWRGVKKGGIHEFRRTYATALIESNVDDKRVQKYMGHKNWSTTKDYYQYTDQVPDAFAGQVVSAAIWGKPLESESA